MSYAVYTTRGFILGSVPSGEASKLYHIYTEDFGLIFAKAQGVRLLASKLRYNLEEYSFATFSLVRGKEVWRLTGAGEKIGDPHFARIYARVLNLVRRLVQGEEKNPELFASLLFMIQGMPGIMQPTQEDMTAFEHLVLIHILSSLGYIDAKVLVGIARDATPSLADLGAVKAKKREVIAEINKALRESQL
ncbi:MAG TPA: recombination protein O N-terminal domain-containing protein [Candidatus Paceibacterota bacterium]